MAPIIKVNLEIPRGTLNASMEYILELSIPKADNSTTAASRLSADYAGAMWFTVAVVLVYGVGTIGLLGISARRNRAMELMDKEVNEYLRNKFAAGGWAKSRRKQLKGKKPVYELIKTSDPSSKSDVWTLKATEQQNFPAKSYYRCPKPKLIRAKTWAGGMSMSMTKILATPEVELAKPSQNPRGLDPLPVIREGSPLSESGGVDCDGAACSKICVLQETIQK